MNLKPEEMFVAGFTDGTIRLYKYPVLFDRAEFIEFKAHKGAVVSVCITMDNKHIVSAGQEDATIVVWSLNRTGNADSATP